MLNNGGTPHTVVVDWPGSNPTRVTQTALDTITIQPNPSDGELISTQWYDVRLPQGMVTDLAGNPMATVTGTFCFRVADTTPPFIVDYVPGLGAVGVAAGLALFLL